MDHGNTHKKALTASKDLSLLDSELVEDGTSLQDLEVRGTGVGDARLDGGVASGLDLDIEGAVALVEVDDNGAGNSGEAGEAGEELHGEGWTKKARKVMLG